VGDYLYFRSGAKPPYHMLSNFYQCKVEYEGFVFNNAEHAYQASKLIKNDKKRLAVGEDLSEFKAFETYKSVFFGKKAALKLAQDKIGYWSKKKCIGIVSKMALKNAKELGLTYASDIETTKEEKVVIFRDILRSKYMLNADLSKVLLDTGDAILIEFVKLAKRIMRKGTNQ